MLQLLAAAVATFSSLQRLFKQTFRFHDGGGFFLRQQDVRRGAATGEEESGIRGWSGHRLRSLLSRGCDDAAVIQMIHAQKRGLKITFAAMKTRDAAFRRE